MEDNGKDRPKGPVRLSSLGEDPSRDWESGKAIDVSAWREYERFQEERLQRELEERESDERDGEGDLSFDEEGPRKGRSRKRGEPSPKSEAQVLSKYQGLCAKKECCSTEVRRKVLYELGGDSAAADRVLRSLIGDSFIDDSRYVHAFVSDKTRFGGWGRVKIRQALRQKGLPEDIITEALSGIDPEVSDRTLRNLLLSKYRSLREDPQCKFKLLRYALSRGYTYEEVRDTVDEVLSSEGEDTFNQSR